MKPYPDLGKARRQVHRNAYHHGRRSPAPLLLGGITAEQALAALERAHKAFLDASVRASALADPRDVCSTCNLVGPACMCSWNAA